MSIATLPLPLGIQRAIHGQRTVGFRHPSREPVSFAGCFRGPRRGCRGRGDCVPRGLRGRDALGAHPVRRVSARRTGRGNSSWFPLPWEDLPRVWLLVPIAVLGGLVTGWVTRRFAPEAAGSGSDTAIREYYDACGRVHIRVAVVKILATALTIGTGGSGGREGPMIQVGAGMGSWLAGWFGLGAAGRRVLLAAGMGAAVAAVFRTPLGGTLFAAEVLNRSEEIESEVLIPAGTAAVTAHMTAGAVLGWGPVLPAFSAPFAAPLHFAAYALLALVLVVLARLYVLLHHRTSGWFARLPVPEAVKPALARGWQRSSGSRSTSRPVGTSTHSRFWGSGWERCNKY